MKDTPMVTIVVPVPPRRPAVLTDLDVSSIVVGAVPEAGRRWLDDARRWEIGEEAVDALRAALEAAGHTVQVVDTEGNRALTDWEKKVALRRSAYLQEHGRYQRPDGWVFVSCELPGPDDVFDEAYRDVPEGAVVQRVEVWRLTRPIEDADSNPAGTESIERRILFDSPCVNRTHTHMRITG